MQTKTVKADLHYHGPIGFQPYWMKVQGYDGKNPLKMIVDSALNRDIGILAITSQSAEIPRGSIHDRLNYLIETFASDLPRKTYLHGKLDENVFAVERNSREGRQTLYLVNGQTVMVNDNGSQFDHLIVGSNQIRNGMSLKDTLQAGTDVGAIQISEHPLATGHFGIGMNLLKHNWTFFDAIEGHNSQLRVPYWAASLPIINRQLHPYSMFVNDETIKFAETHKKPWIAVSDGHRIEDAGISYIEIPAQKIKPKSLVADLKPVLIGNHFIPVANYQPFSEWLDWTIKFKAGCLVRKLKKDNL